MAEYRARFPSKREAVPRARRAIADFARLWFSSDALADIECSVGEALANAFEHGGATDPFFEVHCRFDRGALVIDIRDYGGGFASWNATDYIRPLSDAPRGFGIFIMRQLMDTIEYSERGARIRLTKRVAEAGGRKPCASVDGETEAGLGLRLRRLRRPEIDFHDATFCGPSLASARSRGVVFVTTLMTELDRFLRLCLDGKLRIEQCLPCPRRGKCLDGLLRAHLPFDGLTKLVNRVDLFSGKIYPHAPVLPRSS